MSYHYKIKKSVLKGYYWFVTADDITYRCVFTSNQHSGYLLDLKLDKPVYTFSFFTKNHLTGPVLDRKIGYTISQLLNRFFHKNPDAVLFYICDNSDGKGGKRLNHFKKWFEQNNSELPKKTMIYGNVFGIIHAGVIVQEMNSERIKIRDYFREQLDQLLSADKPGSIEELS